MLRDFLHEGAVIELVNLFKLPIFGRHFELEGWCAHRLLRGINENWTSKTHTDASRKSMADRLPAPAQPVKENHPLLKLPNSSIHDIYIQIARFQAQFTHCSMPFSYKGRRPVESAKLHIFGPASAHPWRIARHRPRLPAGRQRRREQSSGQMKPVDEGRLGRAVRSRSFSRWRRSIKQNRIRHKAPFRLPLARSDKTVASPGISGNIRA